MSPGLRQTSFIGGRSDTHGAKTVLRPANRATSGKLQQRTVGRRSSAVPLDPWKAGIVERRERVIT